MSRDLARRMRLAGVWHAVFWNAPRHSAEYTGMETQYFGLQHITTLVDEWTVNIGLVPQMVNFTVQVSLSTSYICK